LHVKPQLVPSQVAVAFSGGPQGAQREPQLWVLASSAQAPPHAW
jgi:hypothetical protein